VIVRHLGLVERRGPRREACWEFLFALALATEGVDLIEEQLDVAHAGDATLWKHHNPKVHPCAAIRRGVESRVIALSGVQRLDSGSLHPQRIAPRRYHMPKIEQSCPYKEITNRTTCGGSLHDGIADAVDDVREGHLTVDHLLADENRVRMRLNFKISRFQDFKISRFQDFKISRFQDKAVFGWMGLGRGERASR
jgi:hypothetical protein